MIKHVRRGMQAVLLLLLFLSGPVFAPVHTGLSSLALAQGQSGGVDEATLEKFAVAAREVVAVRQEYEPLIRTAPNAEMAKALSEDARAKMDAAFASAGITPQRYLEIAQAAQTDAALRERIQKMLKDETGQ